ncbi:MAG: hypothetical protein ACRDKT_10825 [Actinomycetota bacterium]
MKSMRQVFVVALAVVQIGALPAARAGLPEPPLPAPKAVTDSTVTDFGKRMNTTLGAMLEDLLPKLERLRPPGSARERPISLSTAAGGGNVHAEGLGLLAPIPRRYDLTLELTGVKEPNAGARALKLTGILQFDFVTHGKGLADGLFLGVVRLGGRFKGSPEVTGEVRNGKIIGLVVRSGSSTSRYGKAPSSFVTYTGTLAGAGYYERGLRDGVGKDARFDGPYGVAVDNDTGNVYVTDRENDALRKITPSRRVTTLAEGLDGPTDLDFDNNGDLIMSQYTGSVPLGRVDLSTGVVTPVVYNRTEEGDDLCGRIGGSCDGRSPIGTMESANGIDVEGGVIYAAQNNYPASLKMILPDGTVSTIHDSGAGGRDGGDCGEAGTLGGNSDVAKGNDGKLYYTIFTTGCYGVLVLEPNGTVTTLAGKLDEYGLKDGTGQGARFFGASSLAYDGDRYLYVSDSNNSLLRRVDVYTGQVVRIAGCISHDPRFDCTSQTGFRDGWRDRAQFESTAGIALDDWGDLYVADRRNNAIRIVRIIDTPERDPLITDFAPFAVTRGQSAMITVSGKNLGLAESATLGDGIDVVDLRHAGDRKLELDITIDPLAEVGPRSLVVNTPYGSVTTPTALSFRILGDDVRGAEVTTIAGNGTWLPTGITDGPAQNARFGFPTGIDVQDFDRVLVVDTLEQRVRLLATKDGASDELLELLLYAAGVPSAVGSIVTGLSEIGQFLEGLGIAGLIPNATESTLREPIRQTIDAACAPVGADCHRLVMPWAGQPLNSGGQDGFRLESSLYLPTDVAAVGSGDFFVADAGNSRIRTIGINPVNDEPQDDPFITFSTDTTRNRPFGVADGPGDSAIASYPASHEVKQIELVNGGEETLIGGVTNEIGCLPKDSGHPLGVPLGMDTTNSATYVADPFCQTIWRIENGTVYDLRGSLRLPGPALGPCSDGPAAFAGFGAPIDVQVDSDGNIWFVDAMCGSVRVVRNLFNTENSLEYADVLSELLSTFSDHLPPELGQSYAQALDGLDENFLATNAWWVTTVAGSMNGERGFVDGPAEDARFILPVGIAVASRDNRTEVFVTDAGAQRIRLLTVPGGF